MIGTAWSRWFGFTVLLGSLGAPAVAQRPAVAAAVQAVVDSVRAANPDIPSIAVHLESPKLGLSWTTVTGVADPASRAVLGRFHAFRMASNTKTYVAAAILRLWEQGKLRLDDPIARYLSAQSSGLLSQHGYDPKQITVRHLLSHTSGLYDYAMDTAYAARVTANPRHRWTRKEQLEGAMTFGPAYGAPGEVYHYADTGYILLGEIIERLFGQPLGPALRTLLHYDRLGLRSTWLETLEPKPATVRDRAHQFQAEADTYNWDPSLDLYGGGGLAATTKDMAVFTRALFTGGIYQRPTTIDTMRSRVEAKQLTTYRLGIGETNVLGFRGYGHSGYWNTTSQYFPDLDLAIAVAVQQNGKFQVTPVVVREVLARVRPDRTRMIGRLQATLDTLVASDSTIPGTAVHLESPAMGLSWSGAAGINDRSTRTKLLPNQPMRMASNTKTYTATAILRLAEDGRLSIDDPIAKYLSDEMQALLKSGGYDPAAITIRQVLRHVSGLYDYGADSAYAVAVVADPAHRWTRREQVAFAISHGKPQGPPGQVFHYSDTGYILLGEIIERLTGLTFGAALRSLIDYQAHQLYWTWLESIDPDPWYGSNRAHQYFGGTDTWSFDPSFDLYGGGGLAAPVKDMALFTRALVRGEIYRKPATVDLMLERSGPKPERDYRMGIYRTGPDGLEGFGHTGFWGTFSFYFPEADLAVAGSITEHFATGKMNGLLAELVRAVRETP